MLVFKLPYRISPFLFAVAKILAFVSGYVGEPESSLLKGVAAFLEVVTGYLLAKGVILGLKAYARRR
jgi:hypothetical protein